jgi:hypothetical protein
MTKHIYLVVSLLYGVWLDIATASFAGMGERQMVAWAALFGSPLSLAGLPGWPVWLLFGYLVSRKRSHAAVAVVVVHYAFAPIAIWSHINTSWSADWQQLQQLLSSYPLWTLLTFGSYLLGQVIAWVSIARSMRPGYVATRSTSQTAR